MLIQVGAVGRDVMPALIAGDSRKMAVKAETAAKSSGIGGVAVGADVPGVLSAPYRCEAGRVKFQHLVKSGLRGRIAAMKMVRAAGSDTQPGPVGVPGHGPDSSGLRILQPRHSW